MSKDKTKKPGHRQTPFSGAYTLSPRAVHQVKTELEEKVKEAFESFLFDCRQTIKAEDEQAELSQDIKSVAGMLKAKKQQIEQE